MALKYTCTSEFMDNYKMLYAASTEHKIQAIRVDHDHQIFSIGDDGGLYVMSEGMGKKAAYQLTTLTASLSSFFQDKPFTTKDFVVNENAHKYTIAAIISCENEDQLFISQSDSATVTNWKLIAVDNDTIQTKSMAKVYCNVQDSEPVIICDVLNKDGYISRYLVDFDEKLGKKKKWISHPLPSNFEVSNATCVGKRQKELVEGVYSLGTLNDQPQLLYTPMYNVFDPDIMPNPVRFELPKKVDVIASVGKEYTHLFACGSGVLYLYPSDKQKDNVRPIEVAKSNKFLDVVQLYAFESHGNMYVYGCNQNHQVFYCFCQLEAISEVEKWSEVLLLREDAQYLYAYANHETDNESILAYLIDQSILTGDKAKESSIWQFSTADLMLSQGKSQKFASFSTKITVTDEKDMPFSEQLVYIKAEKPCNVYINQIYYALKENPIQVRTDHEGVIKVIQKTQSPTPYEFTVWQGEEAVTQVFVGENAMDKLFDLNTAEKLKAATINNSNGCKPLVPEGTPDDAISAVADVIDQLGLSRQQIYRSSSLQGRKCCMKNSMGDRPNGVMICLDHGKLTSYRGNQAFMSANSCHMMISKGDAMVLNSVWDDISYAFSDALNFLKDLGDKVCHFFIGIVEDVCEFVIEIAGKVYHFVIDCIEKAIACIETVFEMIKVAIQDVIEFLKFIFDWDDILKTKHVIIKCVNLGMEEATHQLASTQEEMDEVFESLIKMIDEWANIDFQKELEGKSIKEISEDNPTPSTSSVTDTFLMDHYKENCGDTQIEGLEQLKQVFVSATSSKDFVAIFEELAEDEKAVFETALHQMLNIFEDDLTSKSIGEILKAIAGIMADSVIYSMKNVLDAMLELVKELILGIMEVVNKKIHIPVLSDILEDLFGIEPFLVLEVMALITASVVTPMYKLFAGKPLISETTYQKVMAAHSLVELKTMKLACQGVPNKMLEAQVDHTLLDLCVAGHISSGFFGMLDVITHPVFLYSECSEAQIISAVLGGLSVGAGIFGYFMYSPYDVPKWMTGTKVFIKYIPLVGKIANAVKKPQIAGNLCFGQCTNAVYAIGNAIDCIFLGILIVEATKEEDANKRLVALLELPANILGNLVSVGDVITKYDKEPYSRAIIEGVREVVAFGNSGLQIAESGVIAGKFY